MWYDIENINTVDSPTLVIYLDRVERNIDKVIEMAGSPERLRPHIKTHKTPQIIDLHLQKGIVNFKCATIAEAEICGMSAVKSVLLAHQLTFPKYERWVNLIQKYPNTNFACIVDNRLTIEALETVAREHKVRFELFLDINNGMKRSGTPLNENTLNLCKIIAKSDVLVFGGLHVYDGHVLDFDFETRLQHGNNDFQQITTFIRTLEQENINVPEVVVGGSPSFPVHVHRPNVTLSPGTYVFWDKGYNKKFPDIPFEFAALVMTRVISKLDEETICVDLGHKSIASENPHPRVYFLNCQIEKFIIHSEEHLTIKTPDAKHLQVGDVLYGVPHHICPTVNLTDWLTVIENGKATQKWDVIARKRKVTV